jgi:hypothetical protein
MNKQKYLSDLIRLLSIDEIKLSVSKPSKGMTSTHIKLHYVALRRLGEL